MNVQMQAISFFPWGGMVIPPQDNSFAYLYTTITLRLYWSSTTYRIVKQLPYNQCMVFHFTTVLPYKIKATKLESLTEIFCPQQQMICEFQLQEN